MHLDKRVLFREEDASALFKGGSGNCVLKNGFYRNRMESKKKILELFPFFKDKRVRRYQLRCISCGRSWLSTQYIVALSI
jgi:hypothetical protein